MSPELKNLTPVQRETVILASLPEVKGNLSEVARRRGVSRQNVSHQLTKSVIADAIETRKARHLDKARGALKNIQSARNKLLARLDRTAEDDSLSPVEIAGLLKVALESEKLARDLGIGTEDTTTPQLFASFMERVKLRAMRVGWDMATAGEDRP